MFVLKINRLDQFALCSNSPIRCFIFENTILSHFICVFFTFSRFRFQIKLEILLPKHTVSSFFGNHLSLADLLLG